MSILSLSAIAAAQDATEAPTSDEASSDKPEADDPQSPRTTAAAPDVTSTREGVSTNPHPPDAAPELEQPREDWHMEVHGYFRAPMSLSFSPRPNPDTPNGPPKGQISYAPNRVMDWSYYSFAYTRLQEQDWAELTFHMKKKHVDAAVGWMGYWLAASGFRNPDAAAVPGVASLTLDTDFDLASLKPNIALQMGAWWPGFGYFEKYDTFTLGRFRQIGEQVKLTVPVNPDLSVELIQGFGTGRDGSFGYGVAANSPLYASTVGADLIAYGNVRLRYKKNVDISVHYNNEWTRDPYLTAAASPTDGKAYSQAADAHLSVVGAEASLTSPYLGHLWISPSYISVKNGWALGGGGGTEVMHAQGGLGIATNYLAWTNSPTDSTGTGSMFNLGFLYENSFSSICGKTPGSLKHDLKLNVFGLLADAKIDLPAGTTLSQTAIKQFKIGADLTEQALDWLGVTLRWDSVNYDTQHPGYIFSAITARLSVYSHFLSSESIYLQYTRYNYGDRMNLAGKWPWGSPLVAGTDVIQGGTYQGQKPDMDVIKLQATVAF
jgi:hypothetical protein